MRILHQTHHTPSVKNTIDSMKKQDFLVTKSYNNSLLQKHGAIIMVLTSRPWSYWTLKGPNPETDV